MPKIIPNQFSGAAVMWLLCLALIATSLAAMAFGVWKAHAAHDRLGSLRQAEAQLAQMSLSIRQPVKVDEDFAASLRPAEAPARFLAALERETVAASVTVTGLSVQNHAASGEALGRQEFTVVLRGAYEPTKQVLRGLISQYERLSLRTLRMRKDTGNGTLESSVVLSLWSAPLLAATPTAASAPR